MQELRVASEGVAARSVLSKLAAPTADLGSGWALLLSRRCRTAAEARSSDRSAEAHCQSAREG